MMQSRAVRRFVIALFFFMAALTQFQTLYACEQMEHERLSTVCCCDEPGEMELSCELGGACQDQAGLINEGCCTVSYESSQIAQTVGSQFQQVVLFDAPQASPLLLFDGAEIACIHCSRSFNLVFSSPLPDKTVYFLTGRFRI
ncbi:MAG: hypothetical protein Q9O24_01725 [Gammaproteobacteria bacterium]|nr:hypothetical protein [Gammaproteobacteria bacterium]